MSQSLAIATWKHDKDWAYSITYDEALADLSRFVIPTHQELGLPGHVEVVAGQIGEVRDCGASSYNGMRHMNSEELRSLIKMGWGVGCHSWSHGMVMDDPDLELRKAKETIEAAIGRRVTIYTAPGSNENLTPEVLAKIPAYGYLAGMSITDDINYPGPADLVWINRVAIHERYWGCFDSAFDAHKRIRQVQDRQGWLVDYLHCPLEQPVHEYKDCSAAHHRERLEAVKSEGGDDCWYANPDEVVDYRYMRRHTSTERDEAAEGTFVIRIRDLPEHVVSRELTFLVKDLPRTGELAVEVDGVPVSASPTPVGDLSFTVDAHDGMRVALTPKRS